MDLGFAATRAIELLEGAGFEAYAVGGCVRDSLMGRPSGDHDITTDARVPQMRSVFESAGAKVLDTGVAHGTLTVVLGEGAQKEALQITTYRIDGEYLDNRHPAKVEFTRSLEKDLARRDFTINAMAYNPHRGLVDLFGGQADLKAGIVRCVGNPHLRFSEDALRIMRALRFASQLSFSLEPATAKALSDDASLLDNISRERIGTEMTKLICGVGMRHILLDYVDVIGVAIPQVLPMHGFEQHNDHHIYDIYGHCVAAADYIPPRPVLRYAALLHDSGKVAVYENVDGVGRFPGHEKYSVPIAKDVCDSLRLPNTWTDQICTIIKYHGVVLQPNEINMRHWMNRLGAQTLRDLLWMKRADIMGLAPQYHYAVSIFYQMDAIIDKLLAEGACYRISDLAVDGNDLLEIGIPQGPKIGDTLSWLLEEVMDGDLENERDALLARAAAREREA